MAEESKIQKSASINIKTLELVNYKTQASISLINIFTDFHIYASVDNACLTGSISIMEKRNNLISLLPIAGFEYIKIEFEIINKESQKGDKTPVEYKGVFFITSVAGLSSTSESRSFTMNFVSSLGIINPDIRICRAYPSVSDKKEYKCEDILKDIEKIVESPDSKNQDYEKIFKTANLFSSKRDDSLMYLSKDTFIDTIYPYKLAVPSWKPIALINYIVPRAVSKKCNELLTSQNQFCDCVFYENINQIHEFNSYYNMFNTTLKNKKGEDIELVQRVANIDSGEKLYNIISWNMTSIFDVQQQKMRGLTGNMFYVSDFLNNQRIPIEISNQNIQGTMKKYMEDFSDEIIWCPFDSIKVTSNPIYNIDIYGINAEQDENYFRDFITPYLKSMSIVQYLRAANINIKTNATTDLDIGRYIHLKIAEPAQYNTDINNNKIRSFIEGTRWVIGGLAYHVYGNMTMEVDLSCFTPYLNRYYDGKNFS